MKKGKKNTDLVWDGGREAKSKKTSRSEKFREGEKDKSAREKIATIFLEQKW